MAGGPHLNPFFQEEETNGYGDAVHHIRYFAVAQSTNFRGLFHHPKMRN